MGSGAIGRLKDGITLAQAQADLDSVAAGLAPAYPEADKGVGVYSLKQDRVGDIAPFLLVLLAAVGFVLLIACANVANLLLVRAKRVRPRVRHPGRPRSGQRRIVRQLLCESVLLGLIAGVLGLALAAWSTRIVLATLPSALPRQGEIRLDLGVLLFTLGLSIAVGILFGLVPALRARRPDLHGTLKEGGRGTSTARHRVQTTLVVLEMAMSLVLLIGADLMVRTLAALWSVSTGFYQRPDARHRTRFPPERESRGGSRRDPGAAANARRNSGR
jgi:hypothetical protein